MIGIWGPRARTVLAAVCDGDVGGEALPFGQAREIGVGPARVLAQRITYVGELGFELYVEPTHAVQVWDRLWAAGRKEGVAAGGYRVLDGLRAEKGYRYMGTDLTAGDTPYAAGLGFCVALDKGEFMGREALADPAARTPSRRLRTIVVGEGAELPLYGGEAVRVDGAVASRVRSCAYGHTVGRTIAFAYLPAELAPGDPVEVEVLGRPHPAAVAERVLHDPENLRIRAGGVGEHFGARHRSAHPIIGGPGPDSRSR